MATPNPASESPSGEETRIPQGGDASAVLPLPVGGDLRRLYADFPGNDYDRDPAAYSLPCLAFVLIILLHAYLVPLRIASRCRPWLSAQTDCVAQATTNTTTSTMHTITTTTTSNKSSLIR
ncbi:hypothetical protein E2C01_035033 [Portunus trituberculatus]|uniref:Uncharacterized protein n=1 Tax=Portunus trituberculatus TaxID=210409 RepID=A0A5B7F4H2_PORTR|nr:hypothetical protein [Portunus trituberculatus]